MSQEADGETRNSCEYCGPTLFANIDTHECAQCELGKFSVGGGNSCSTCEISSGFVGYVASEERSSCRFCGAGKKAVGGDVNDCVKCVLGKYSPGGTSSCTDCQGGKVTTSEAASSCAACAPGSVPNEELTECVSCLVGKYAAFEATSCDDCDGAGLFSGAGSVYCSTAGAGKKPNGARSAEENCPANTFSVGASNTCTDCSGGHSGAGASSCVSTPPGQYWSGMADVNCPAGKFSENGATNLAGCGACNGSGQFSDAGSAFCSTAGAGKKPNTDRSGEENCPVDTFSVGASNTCTDCSGGHSNPGSSSCVSTPPGQYWSGTADVNCPAGTFSENGASSLVGCASCDGPGQFSPAGSSYCSVVGGGRVPANDRSSFSICPKNTFSTGAVNSCTPCQTGHAPAGSVACIFTPVGYYFNEVDSSDITCPAGKHSSGASSLSGCLPCDDGFVANNPGSGFCSVCVAGRHSTNDHTHCLNCQLGKLSGTAASECQLCPSGKFSGEEGSSECTLCTDVIKKSDTLIDVVGATSASQCYCKSGWFLDATGENCEELMEGVEADEPKSTLANLPLEPGFWRTTDFSLEVKRCMVAEACVGGNETDAYCRVGHTGPYCNVCEEDYSKDIDQTCQPCEGQSRGSSRQSLLFFFGFVFVALLFKKLVYNKHKKAIKGAVRIMFVSYQIIAVLPSIFPEMNLPENFMEFLSIFDILKLDLWR